MALSQVAADLDRLYLPGMNEPKAVVLVAVAADDGIKIQKTFQHLGGMTLPPTLEDALMGIGASLTSGQFPMRLTDPSAPPAVIEYGDVRYVQEPD